MKHYILVLIAILKAYGAAAKSGSEVLVFRPSRGLNNGADQGGANAGKDAWVFQDQPGQVNDTSYMIYSMPVSNCNSTHAWSLIRFDLDGLPMQVDSVFVGFTHYAHTNYCYSHCDANWYFYKITSDWEENTVTYNNAPTTGDSFYGPVRITFPNALGTREYNITDQYVRWKNNTDVNKGFAIKSPNVGCNNAAVGFYVYSSDDTAENARPYLKIYYQKTTGVSSIDSKFSVFPNPADDQVIIRSSVNISGEALLFDAAGRQVWSGQLTAGAAVLDVSDLTTGVYQLKISAGNEMVSRRLLIQKR